MNALNATTVQWIKQQQTAGKQVGYLQTIEKNEDRLCGLVVIVPGYRSRGPGSIPGATTFSEK
jgi:hypothetical protein